MENGFEKEMLEQILRATSLKSLIYLEVFIGRVVKLESLSIHWTAEQLGRETEKDSLISQIELREGENLVGSIHLVFPREMAFQVAKEMYADLIPEISERHVLDMLEEMTNIISAPLTEAITFCHHTTVLPSVARVMSPEEFKSSPVDGGLVLEVKMDGEMRGGIFFVMEKGTVKKIRRMLKMKARG
ncbi:hypothetical protein B6V00_03060 [ANME-1 cluster archaeon ex4572_4]|nr:MAG: hypothetical protein B6V00_03060 [ANME-1 cluster archaeon ex4572_4]